MSPLGKMEVKAEGPVRRGRPKTLTSDLPALNERQRRYVKDRDRASSVLSQIEVLSAELDGKRKVRTRASPQAASGFSGAHPTSP